MSAPKTLAESWRNGLQQALQSLRARQSRRRWLDLAQLRIFKFLLRTYGDSTQDRYAAKLPDNVLFDQSERGCGRPARTAAQIQPSLKRIGAQVPEIASGTPQRPLEWTVVACYSRSKQVATCMSALRESGIPAQRQRRGTVLQIEVPRKDFESALAVVESTAALRAGELDDAEANARSRARRFPRSSKFILFSVVVAAILIRLFQYFFIKD